MSDINEIKRIVTESRVHGVYNWNLETIASLITTIESQEEQITAYKLGMQSAYEVMEMQRLKLESQKEEIEKLNEQIAELCNGCNFSRCYLIAE